MLFNLLRSTGIENKLEKLRDEAIARRYVHNTARVVMRPLGFLPLYWQRRTRCVAIFACVVAILLLLSSISRHSVKTEGLQRPEIKSDSHLQEVINDQKTYEEWQGSKIQSNAEWVYAVDEKVYLRTKKRYASLDVRGLNLLCIGARAGGEVRAFIGLGAYALGIDVAPSPKSKYVLYGDGRNLQFASTSVDIIFTNVLDHIPDLTLFAKEVARVLKPNGILIAEVLVQLRTDDEWAVRDTGTDAFYAEFEASIRNTSMIACHVDHGVHKYNQLIVLQSLQASDQKCTGINVAALSTINVNRV